MHRRGRARRTLRRGATGGLMSGPSPSIVVCPDPASLALRAADEFEKEYAKCGAAGRAFSVAISGGKTPQAMLSALAQRHIDWSRVHCYWSDERCVPPDDPSSNFKMA